MLGDEKDHLAIIRCLEAQNDRVAATNHLCVYKSLHGEYHRLPRGVVV